MFTTLDEVKSYVQSPLLTSAVYHKPVDGEMEWLQEEITMVSKEIEVFQSQLRFGAETAEDMLLIRRKLNQLTGKLSSLEFLHQGAQAYLVHEANLAAAPVLREKQQELQSVLTTATVALSSLKELLEWFKTVPDGQSTFDAMCEATLPFLPYAISRHLADY